jgi:predicted chitinase
MRLLITISMKLVTLDSVGDALPLEQLSESQLAELQRALSLLGYPLGDIDGLIGPRTRTAWAEFKTDVFQGNPSLIGSGSVQALQDKLDAISPQLNGRLTESSSRAEVIEAIKQECKDQGIGLHTQIAYVLATTEWETAQTFKPVREAFWQSEEWRRNNFRYYPYYGRGYVQLTWKGNYEKFSTILGLDLVGNPDLAMNPNIALFILVYGFKMGSFTGRKMTDYITERFADFFSARRIINGTDKYKEIADLADKYLASL